MDMKSDKEKRAELQKQAYGKLYAYCNKCFLPLIPTSQVTTDFHQVYSNRFIRCCEDSNILFGEDYEINMLKFSLST